MATETCVYLHEATEGHREVGFTPERDNLEAKEGALWPEDL